RHGLLDIFDSFLFLFYHCHIVILHSFPTRRSSDLDLPGSMYTYGELTIGMGDLVFYSLVATTAMVFFGLFSFFATAIGILAGSYLGFRALSKYEMFPGLPFSLLLGVVGMLLTAAVTGTLRSEE